MSNLPLIGRETDKEWLAASAGDVVVAGHPASGKTHLLRQFVGQGWLFLVDRDRARLASAVRDLCPEVVIVDDAHDDLESLRCLVHLRQSIGAEYRVAAVTWTGHKDEVMGALAIPSSSALDLQLLSRDDILEVAKAIGIEGPVELQRAIVNQSGGRPGLTATLCDSALRGDILELFSGDSLLREIRVSVGSIDEPASLDVLAIMALAGESGASLISVASALRDIGSSVPNMRRILIQLGHIGLFRILALDGQVTISPPELRFALVGDAFFAGMSYQNIPLEIAAAHLDKRGIAGSLVGASLMGAEIPDDTIEGYLVSAGSLDDFKGYAQVGRRQASFALRERPEWLNEISPYSLLTNPSETIPMLLARAVGDRRPLHSHPDHPLRILEDWVESAPFSGDEQLERRELLASIGAKYSERGGDSQVVVQALCLAMNPKYESSNMDAGSGHSVAFNSGIVSRECLSGLVELWPTIRESIPLSGPTDYSMIYEMLYDWTYYGRSRYSPAEDVREMMGSHAKKMANDLANRFANHPGILSEIRGFSQRADLGVSISIPEVFAVLFPEESFGAGVDDLDEQERVWREEARRLAVKLEPLGPDNVLGMVRHSIKTAAEAGRGCPDMTGLFVDEIARMTDEPFTWAAWAVAHNLSAVVVEPLLREARSINPEQCLPLMLRALGSDLPQAAAVVVVLTAHEPFDVELDTALEVLPTLWTMRNILNGVVGHIRSSINTLRRLLRHPSSKVAEIAAVRLCLSGENHRVPGVLSDDWKAAIVRSQGIEYMLSVILVSDAELFYEWLIERIATGVSSETHEFIRHVDRAFEKLSFSQRIRILSAMNVKTSAMHGKIEFYFAPIVAKLVGEHAEVLEALLSMESLREYHQAGFVSASDSKIIVASRAGWSPIQIAQAIASPSMIVTSWHGPESEHWQTWLRYFATLSESADPRVAAVGQSGCTWVRTIIDSASRRELDEEIYGR